MQNTEENVSQTLPSSLKPVSKLLDMISQIPVKPALRSQIHTPIYIVNILLTLLIYLSMKPINLIPILLKIDSELIVICMVSSLLIILFQCIIALLYGKQIFIKLQFMVYVNIILPASIYILLGFTGWDNTSAKVGLGVTLGIFIPLSVCLQAIIGKECYAANLIVDRGLPLTFYLFLFSISHYLYACTSQPYQLLGTLLMALFSLYTKLGLIDQGFRRSKCIQYTLLRVKASLNLLYTALVIAQSISSIKESTTQPFLFIFPLILFLAISQFMGQYTDQMKPLPPYFFQESTDMRLFLQCVQYISDDLIYVRENTSSQNVRKTCLIPFYYSHLKACKPDVCQLSHQLDPKIMNSSGNFKLLTTSVFKIVEMLFYHFLEFYYKDVELRIAFINFYALWGQSNAKMLYLLAQTQMGHLTWTQKIRLSQIKKSMGGGHMRDQNKVEDSFLRFKHSISSLMKLLLQFWAQFTEQRIDFEKVLQVSQKITVIMNQIQTQMQQTLKLETFQSIKILKIYSQYCRWIHNDEVKSLKISDYTNLLSKKISEVSEINSISADMEVGLIAISLNFRKIGEIKIANSQAANIFNYNKEEFLKVNVNCLMPSLISKHHDDYLRAFISFGNKKVNSDRRLLLGKKKQNYLFQIFLQLQKSVVTHTDELIFIANIEIAKMKQAVIILVCDDKGLITDFNSTYYEIFEKGYKKSKTQKQKRYSNIQQLISNFFEIALNESKDPKTSIECYDNPTFGIIQIRFQIVKLSIKQNRDMGYIVKGYRIYEPKDNIFTNLSLSAQLIQKTEERDLKGMKLQYSSAVNEYHFNESLDIFNCGQFHSDFTIPYFKLQLLGGLITQSGQNKNLNHYDADIKTLRFMGDHFQRVQQIQSFESEISEQQKGTINQNRFLIIKQKLESEKKNIHNKLPQALSLLLLTINLIVLVVFYINVSQEKFEIFNKANHTSEAYLFRSKLSEYILYFQAQNDPTYGPFFMNHKNILKSELMNDITNANLTQIQKQKALKVVYLEETLKNQSFSELINDETLFIQTQSQPLIQKKFIIFKGLFAVIVALRLLANFVIMKWHKRQIINIFSLFLGLPEMEIKQCQQKCLKFLKSSNQSPEKSSNQNIEYEQQQNSHVKIKRFKNPAMICQSSNFLKLNAFVLVFLAFFTLILINDWKRSQEFQTGKSAYDFVSTVMPEYSAVLMKIYSQKKQNLSVQITQKFVQKYQAIQYNLLLFTNQKNSKQFYKLIMKIMLSDQCTNSTFALPNSLSCQQVCESVMKGGVSKAINYFSHRLAYLNLQDPTKSLSELNELALLLYHLVGPKLKIIKHEIYSELQSQYDQQKIYVLLYLIVMLTLSVSDAVYQHNYPLEQIQKNIIDSKILIGLIGQTNTKRKKNGYTAI